MHRFIRYTVSDGLSQNSVHCIYQDSDGMLWVGTQDGLNQFDGRNFTVYQHNGKDTGSISDQFVLSIAEDRKGFLWIGTRNGLNRFNKYTRKFSRFYLSSGEEENINNTYPRLIKKQNGEIYVEHDDQPGLIDTNGILSAAPIVLKEQNIGTTDRLGRLWTINQTKIGYIDHNKWYEKGTLAGNIKTYPLPVLAIDSIQVFWYILANRENELCFFDLAHPDKKIPPLRLPWGITHINISHSGLGWVSTQNGIYLVNREKQSVQKINDISSSHSLPAGPVLCSFEDAKGYIWVGSALNGTYELKQLNETTYRLYLYSHFKINTSFNFYAGIWAKWIMSDIQNNILQIEKQRAEE